MSHNINGPSTQSFYNGEVGSLTNRPHFDQISDDTKYVRNTHKQFFSNNQDTYYQQMQGTIIEEDYHRSSVNRVDEENPRSQSFKPFTM